MEAVLLGLSLGLAAGATPGPLLTLTVAASLERGFGAGARFAIAPLLSDLPVLLVTLLLLRQVPGGVLALISAAGGIFILALGVATLRNVARGGEMSVADGDAGIGVGADLRKAALVNLLNPNPWIFWAAVGGPILIAAWRRNPLSAVAFVALFYLLLVGSKLVIAALVAGGRHRLTQPWYRRLVGICGLLLLILGAGLVGRSVQLWGGA